MKLPYKSKIYNSGKCYKGGISGNMRVEKHDPVLIWVGISQTGLIPTHFRNWAWFPGGSDGKVSAYNVGDPGSIPGLGRSSGEGNGNPLQYSGLENPMDRRAW